ncbi:hypothetical protein [Pedobacter antarcticus]|uniref:hypothetical protein n=1 Tax=Pedobacter antarcticus TaxID=34086 RepID=UPI0029313C24|nr:hypothetical protein [Pedobacter antarcticus]
MNKLILFSFLLSLNTTIFAQSVKLGKYELIANKVSLTKVKIAGKAAVRIIKDTTVKKVDEPTFAKLEGTDFKNGTIEVKVLSKLLSNAPEFARGFIGIAYRITQDNATYESIYIRPTNGRSEDQVRRNHSIQYYAYPDWKFDKLRKESAEVFEAYADMQLNKWITIRIEVKENIAKLFLDKNKQPSLFVNTPKDVIAKSGGIGLWVDIGTEGFFTDLKITKID